MLWLYKTHFCPTVTSQWVAHIICYHVWHKHKWHTVFLFFLSVVFWLQQTQQLLIWHQASLSCTFMAANCFFRKENVKCKDLKLFASISRSLSTHLNSILDNNLFARTTLYIFIADLLMPVAFKSHCCIKW